MGIRDIIFRGKRVDNGEWVYGNLNYGTIEIESIKDSYYISDFDVNPWDKKFYPVIPESVSQYTGLNDKNGNKIFEGDIVNYNGTVHEVVFCQINGCAFFGITMPDRGEIWNFDGITHPNKMRIIGNIHDNPELLEVEI